MPIALNGLNLDEALRYMGCPPEKADPATLALARTCGEQLLAVIRPRWTYQVFDLNFEEGFMKFHTKPFDKTKNTNLQKNLL